MVARKIWVRRALLVVFLPILAPTGSGPTGPSAAVMASQRARVSVPVDWSTDYVVAPMIQWGGVRILPTNEPRVLHRRLLAQPRTNSGTNVPAASGSVYFEKETSAGNDSVDESPEGRFFNIDGGIRGSQALALGRRRRHSQQGTFVKDWSFPATGGLGGSVAGSPAKFNFDVNAAPSCTKDILYVPVDVTGTPPRVNLIALNNLYTNPSGTGACAGTGPTIVWTLRFSGRISTSPVLSLDGTLLFVVESRATGAIVHAIPTGSVTCPVGGCTLSNPGTVTALWSATLSGSTKDGISSPFIKYTFTTPNQDELFVGDDAGLVHRFTNINTSTGAEITTTPWPVRIASGVQLSSPTVDASTGNLFVGDANGRLNRIVISTGAVTSSAVIGGSSPFGGIMDAPVIDVVNQRVLVTTGNFASGLAALIGQFPENFAPGASPDVQKILGPGGVANMHRPAFDNAFLSTGTGNTYVGGLSVTGSDTVIFRFAYANTNGLSGTGTSVSLTNTGTPAGGETSPVTVFRNGNTGLEFAYISGLAASEQFMNRIDTADFTVVANFDPQLGGTSPIVVDNIGTASEQSNIYFGTRAGGSSRVVKLSQVF